MHFKTESFSYSKWIIVVEIGEIIHKDGFNMARQWSYLINLAFFSCNLRYQIYFINFNIEKMFKPNLTRTH